MSKNSLKKYREKRDFFRTPEPEGAHTRAHKLPLFVIQKHDATSLHYDFRLEEAGVLKSWAIPKGPSTDPHDKRLALMTEDHPLDYAYFEGVIPEGNYGAGQVLVWDLGIFRNLREPLSLTDSIDEGKVEVWLEGKKLHGSYALIKTHFQPNGWLFFKMKDEEAHPGNITKEQPESVLSNKTIEEIE